MKLTFLIPFLLLTSTAFPETPNEITEAFNNLLSNNKYAYLYEGVIAQSSNEYEYLTVYVNDNWKNLSQNERKEFIEFCIKMWGGMHGVRGLDLNSDRLKFTVKQKGSDKTLGTWDSVWGPSIKDN